MGFRVGNGDSISTDSMTALSTQPPIKKKPGTRNEWSLRGRIANVSCWPIENLVTILANRIHSPLWNKLKLMAFDQPEYCLRGKCEEVAV